MVGKGRRAGRQRADAERRVRQAARVLSLRTREYVAHVSHATHLHDADVHAVGVLRAAEQDGVEITAGALARELSLSPAAVTALVDRMERAGHVVRMRLTRDGRSVTLHATEDAHAMSRDMFDHMVSAYREALAGYDDAELALIAEALERLAALTRQGTRFVTTRPPVERDQSATPSGGIDPTFPGV